ncbi:DUF5994 family protein [Nocardia sp. NBC_00511]|uniref:DUF5994 family protein n=1 Tax=Nocardia sp. NBC_00511 TaxID=2903591 RepID=UPI0030E3464A
MIIFDGARRRRGRDRPVRHRDSPVDRPSLWLKPREEDDSYLDGVWWPRSDDLAAELPDLLALLTPRLGPARRVVYDHASWSRPRTELIVGDRVVQIDAYRFELGNTLYVFGVAGGMVVLRVVTSADDRDAACASL